MNRALGYAACAIGVAVGQPLALLAQQSDVVSDTTSAADVQPAGHPVSKTFFTRHDLELSAVALVGSAMVSSFDKRIAHYMESATVQGSTSRHTLVNNLTKVNETTLGEAAVLTYGIGRLAGSSMVADVGLHTAEALLMTSVISQAIRGPLGRSRPGVTDNPYTFKFGEGFTHFDNRSFPSLHSATAFAAAAAISGEIHERNPDANAFISPLIFAAACVPGLTRMYLGEHWASDVVAGAFVGTLIGSRVVSYAHSHNPTKLDRFLLGTKVGSDGHGGTTVSTSITY
jgi:hypothetical protein